MMQIVLGLFLVVASTFAHAQTPPTANDLGAYDGDVVAIRRLANAGADLNIRDQAQCTPAHVAAVASNDAALRALAEAGADMNALENRVYDVLTMAAVAKGPDMVLWQCNWEITPT